MNRSLAVLALVLACLSLAFTASPAAADGFIIPSPPRPLPPIPWRDVPLSVKYHRVTVSIIDRVATTHVDQVFVNQAGYSIEGTYIFPLPVDAAVTSFDMWDGGQKLEGVVMTKEQARATYEEIVRQQKDPALLEYAGQGAFKASIFPIPAGAERRIELSYSQVLGQEGGLVRYRYPLNTEKFSARPLNEVAITVSVSERAPLRAIYSPSHDVTVSRPAEGQATVSYHARDTRPDRDFELMYTLSPDSVAANLLSYKPAGEDGYFLLLLAPPLAPTGDPVAKDVMLVLDTSGSMEGGKLAQTQKAANYVLDHLGAADRFNLLSFSSATRLLAPQPLPAQRVAEGKSFISRLSAVGSTDINRALLEALAAADRTRPTTVIFLTDGLPTMGETKSDRIISNVTAGVSSNVRLFPFGVGFDVDTTLLDQLAAQIRGQSSYVKPNQSIEEEVSAFYARVGAPVLVDTSVSIDGATVSDLVPYPLPDLFAGQQLAIAGRYREGGKVVLTLRGSVNGQLMEYTYRNQQLAVRGGDEFIPALWAQRKIGYLMSQIRLNGAQDELVREIIDLSVRHGIVTPYTSFLVQEPQRALTDQGRQTLSKSAQAAPTASPNRSGAPAAPAPVQAPSLAPSAPSGAGAVARSEAEQKLAGADAAAPVTSSEVRQVGVKAFLLSNGVWTDTSFDSSRLAARPVAFASDAYFALLAANPDLARYLALGDRVIVLLEGTAYAISPEGVTLAVPTPLPSAAVRPPVTVTRPAAGAVPAPGLPAASTPFPTPIVRPSATAQPSVPGAAFTPVAGPSATAQRAAPGAAPSPQSAVGTRQPIPTLAPLSTAPASGGRMPTPCGGVGLVGLMAVALPGWRLLRRRA